MIARETMVRDSGAMTLAETASGQETFADHLDQEAVEHVSRRGGTIASIGQEAHVLMRDTLGGSAQLDWFEDVRKELERRQRRRMQDVHDDTRVRVKNLGEGVGGLYDGERWIDEQVISHGSEGETERVYRHETQHEKDDRGDRGSIDHALLGRTGIKEIDANLPKATKRDVLEKRAMEAEHRPPSGSYVQKHWEPATDLEGAFNAAGVDGKEVLRKLIEDNDIAGFQQARNALLIQRLMGTSQN
jgi:hypothetical protein